MFNSRLANAWTQSFLFGLQHLVVKSSNDIFSFLKGTSFAHTYSRRHSAIHYQALLVFEQVTSNA